MRGLLWVLVLFALIDLRTFGLTDLDEGFYASVAWEMRQSGNWHTPTFMGQPWFEKPPLLYWLMKLSMRAFGEHEFALRLPSAVLYALTMLLLLWWGNRRLGKGVGEWAAVLFGVAPLSLLLARLAITDMALTFFLLVSLIALWEVANAPRMWQAAIWSLLGGVALGLAVLTKGPLGLGLIALLYLWNARMLHTLGLRFRWVVLALIATVLTALPWYVGVYQQHGAAFFNEFVVRQNLLRFAGGDMAHSVLPLLQSGEVGRVLTGIAVYLLFYVVVLWLGGLPMMSAVSVLWQRASEPVGQYLQRWLWLVFGLFTLSFTKLPAYIFPMMPALALLVAQCTMATRAEASGTALPYRMGRGMMVLVGVGAAVWASVAIFTPLWQHAPWAIALAVGAPLCAFALAIPKVSPHLRWAGVLALLIGWNGALTGYDRLALQPVRELALKAPPYRTLILYRVRPGYPSLQFYRKGKFAQTDDATVALKQMQRTGAYCLTTDTAFVQREEVFVVGEATALGKRFYLAAPRYDTSSLP
ncbi:MAG: glycosyltransferase family 39 protein [Fimbriimonadales bacterium]|nr:glycosyltransferase family 39 protein [Fimbriimonadales bacterium]MDW8051067.1 glycosyltransferase family 39 protein [Armatimonadota bacterium]